MFYRDNPCRFEDRTPPVFAPKVAPDPEQQQKLFEKLAALRNRLQQSRKRLRLATTGPQN